MLDWIIGGALIGAAVGVVYAMMSRTADQTAEPNEVAAPSIDQLKELASQVDDDSPAPVSAEEVAREPAAAQPATAEPANPAAPDPDPGAPDQPRPQASE